MLQMRYRVMLDGLGAVDGEGAGEDRGAAWIGGASCDPLLVSCGGVGAVRIARFP